MPKYCVYILDCINCKKKLTYTGYTIDIKKGLISTTIIKVPNLQKEENGKLFIESFLYQKKKQCRMSIRLKIIIF